MIQPDAATASPPSVGERHVAAMRAKNIARNRPTSVLIRSLMTSGRV
jgi:hypothetical protein